LRIAGLSSNSLKEVIIINNLGVLKTTDFTRDGLL